jgi:ferritin-like metal-binding protein YciE
MLGRTLEAQLVSYLTDAHAIEEHALIRMRRAPALLGDPSLAHVFKGHLAETEEHEHQIRERLQVLDAEPPSIKDAVTKAGGGGFTMFAHSLPDTPGKLAAHAYAYEHLELAAYELLSRVAERAGDLRVLSVALRIRDDEQAMADRLEDLFDGCVTAALSGRRTDDVRAQLVGYLADARAIEAQSHALLARATDIAGEGGLRQVCEEHLAQTETHTRRLDELLDAHDAGPSILKDAERRLGVLNWGLFFEAQQDTPGKLVALLFAFEHLEIANYEQLVRVAGAARDERTALAASEILAEERSAAAKLREYFDAAVEATPDGQAAEQGLADAMR